MGASSSAPIPDFESYVVPDSADAARGLGPIYRNPHFKGALLEFVTDDAKTLYECFQRGVKLGAGRPCMGTRPVAADGTVGTFVWKSYGEVAELVTLVGSAFVHLGLAPANGDNLRLVGLYSKNRYEWVVCEQACNAHAITSVPLYDTLGADAVAFVVGQTGLTTVCCSKTEVPKVLQVKADAELGRTLAHVVQYEDVSDAERAKATAAGVSLRSLSELLAIGREHPAPHTPPRPEDVATFCYTSGTTGDPKGAMLTHRNIVSCCAGAIIAGVRCLPDDRHISYLPLAHMFERVVQVALWQAGSSVGFYQGDTLKLMEDIKELHPTIFCSVPRLWNKIYEKVMSGVKAAGGMGAVIFRQAYAAKQYWLTRNELHHGLYDKVVFSKVKAKMGLDNVRIMVTGSAPIAAHVMEFLRIVFACNVVEGYGQTECGAACSITSIADQRQAGHVGPPMGCNEIRLVNVDDMGYLYTDKFHGRRVGADGKVEAEGEPCLGRGEVCYHGPNVFPGYYHNPEKTAEALDADGWLHSGDIGIWTTRGTLKIVDRKKNIFKLSQGEYVAAEKIENAYQRSGFVAQIFVYGDSLQSSLVAIVVPNKDAVKSWAAANGLAGTYEELIANAAVQAAIKVDMDAQGKEAALRGFEKVAAVHYDVELWTPENNVLTPTFKLKRNVAKEKYLAVIQAMYAKINTIPDAAAKASSSGASESKGKD